ncbi:MULTISPECIES: Dps family protein [Flavobacteriaceae]|uniref:DNA starvation/stationary phase protection protein n=2 Tax=Flavobacteriaceae TaxID=49546 RepID=A0A4Y8AVK7_9FLAO|nr:MULTISPECIES: Dps family protein [Flavobacteriaceae]TEW76530.1 DNA starvation/stationary phase protection protein [Gramella jeungdoensis]GGK53711.1 DNA starvation/stationary phase protection protein [Lutibacter litoralis]
MSYLNLDKEKTSKTVFELNILLADYHIYYQKLRNFHWNILGKNFFDLHEKFESMYNDAQKKIDEIAERILTLRYQPLSNYSGYLKISDLKESKSDITDVEMVKCLLKDHTLLINQLRNSARAAENANDDGTADLIGGYIRDIEKTSWMLDAWRLNTSDTLSKPILKSQLELSKTK